MSPPALDPLSRRLSGSAFITYHTKYSKPCIPEIKGPFYVITILDAFLWAILSSRIFQGQDLGCVLIVLSAAVEQF
jgi:hypothetical protein